MRSEKQWRYFANYVEGWNEHDLGLVMDQFAEGGTYVDPLLEAPTTGIELERHFSRITEAFPDLSFEGRVHSSYEEPVIANPWTGTGTNMGSFLGMPPTGQSIDIEGVSLTHLADEGITHVECYCDLSTVKRQLGLTFPAVIRSLPRLVHWKLRHATRKRG